MSVVPAASGVNQEQMQVLLDDGSRIQLNADQIKALAAGVLAREMGYHLVMGQV